MTAIENNGNNGLVVLRAYRKLPITIVSVTAEDAKHVLRIPDYVAGLPGWIVAIRRRGPATNQGVRIRPFFRSHVPGTSGSRRARPRADSHL